MNRTGLLTLLILIAFAAPAFAATGDAMNLMLASRWPDGPCYGVFWEGDIAYFGNGGSVEIVDFSDPGNPVTLAQVLVPGPVLGLDKTGDLLVVAAWTDGLRVINVSNPSSPWEVGHLDTPQYTYDVAVQGTT
ncbi:MAG: hypothetical protein GY778_27530, partial [bacterium]|nr:hypothetical protein [bacterium]